MSTPIAENPENMYEGLNEREFEADNLQVVTEDSVSSSVARTQLVNAKGQAQPELRCDGSGHGELAANNQQGTVRRSRVRGSKRLLRRRKFKVSRRNLECTRLRRA
jgi:hypothetical protein